MSKNAKRRLREIQADPPPARPPPPKRSRTHVERLQAIVTECLGGPKGDPDSSHRLAAAHACILLRELGCPLEATEAELRNDELYECDFIDQAER